MKIRSMIICGSIIIGFLGSLVVLVSFDIYEEHQMFHYLRSCRQKPIPNDLKIILSNSYHAKVHEDANTLSVVRTRVLGRYIRVVGMSSSVLIVLSITENRLSIVASVYYPGFKAFRL
jgi:hypothetical protein